MPTIRPEVPIRMHHFALSGHSHRVLLFLSLLALPYEIVPVDFDAGAHLSPAFLALNPLGQVPVIQDGDYVLPDSNAILVYLAGRYDPEGPWLPRDPVGAAEVQRWLSLAAGWLAFGPAHLRIGKVFGAPIEARAHELSARLLRHMEASLQDRDWLLPGAHPTIADVALHTYTAHAPEGGVDLQPYPAVRRWIAAVESLPGYVGMPKTPTDHA